MEAFWILFLVAMSISEVHGNPDLLFSILTLVALTSSAAVGVVEEATQVVGAAVGRTVEVGVWAFLSLFLLHLLPASSQVKH